MADIVCVPAKVTLAPCAMGFAPSQVVITGASTAQLTKAYANIYPSVFAVQETDVLVSVAVGIAFVIGMAAGLRRP